MTMKDKRLREKAIVSALRRGSGPQEIARNQGVTVQRIYQIAKKNELQRTYK